MECLLYNSRRTMVLVQALFVPGYINISTASQPEIVITFSRSSSRFRFIHYSKGDQFSSFQLQSQFVYQHRIRDSRLTVILIGPVYDLFKKIL